MSALLVLAVGSLVALCGYLALRHSLVGQIERQARDQAAQLAALVEVPGMAAPADAAQNRVDLGDPSLSHDFVRSGMEVQVVGADGRRVQASSGGTRLDAAASGASCLRKGTAVRRQARPPLAVACRRVGPRARPAGAILVGAPLEAALASLAQLRRALLLSLGIGVLLAALAGLALAHRALRPARRIAETAETIRAGELSRRIAYEGPRDELGALAGALDECFAELEQAVERQRRFVADASHELKTPLAAIRAHAELLGGWAAVAPEARGRALSSLDQAARRMGRLVGDLLYLTELDRAPPDERLPVELDRLLLAVIAEAAPLRPEVPIRVCRLDDAVVRGDAVRLQAVLINLIDNALRLSPAGAEVEVALEAGEDTATVTVRDRGPGIPAEALGRIFDRFYRAAAHARTGTGLGLAISREIARAHGGDVTAANEPGGGATLRVSLPLADLTSNLHPAVTDLSSPPRRLPATDEPSTRR
jgi:two-component system OmpR family sensor kinase